MPFSGQLVETHQSMTKLEFEKYLLPLAGDALNYLVTISNNRTACEDAVQDSFLKLWKSRKRIPEIKNYKAYLFSAVRNALIDCGHFNEQKIEYKENEKLNNIKHEIILPEIQMNEKELVSLLNQQLKKLPNLQQEIIFLRDFEGMEFAEIAKITGSNEINIRVNLSRGRKQLRELMYKHYKINCYEA